MPTTTPSRVKHALSWVTAVVCSAVRTPRRLLFVAWSVGCIMVGSAQMAAAETDTFGNTTTPNQFWGVPLSSYTLPPLNLSDAHHGAPYIEESMWVLFHAIGNVLMFLTLAFIRGAITAMQWMVNLTIYQDAAPQIDSAVQALATSLFWPLLGATAAWAACTVIIKYVASGKAVSELLWVIVAGVIAVGFMTAPSRTAGQLDEVRTAVSSAAAEGYSRAAGGVVSSAGLPTTTYPGGRQGAVDRLGDSMWNVYGVTPWCLASFGPDLTVCKDVGHEFLLNTERWKAIDAANHERGVQTTVPGPIAGLAGVVGGQAVGDAVGDASDADPSPPCADELKGHCDIIRGQDYGRLGVILFLFVIGIGLGALLLILVIYGVLALVEFLVLLMMAPLGLVGCMIPGRPRSIGVKWGETLIAAGIATLVITSLIGVVMVLGGIFNGLIETWGLFKVALLNIAVFIAAFRVRSIFENVTGMKSGTSGFGNSYLTMKALTGLAKMGAGGAKMGAKGAMLGGAGARAGVKAGVGQVTNPDSALHKGMSAAGHRMAQVRSYMAAPPRMQQPVPAAPKNQLPAGASHAALPAGPSAAHLELGSSGSTAHGANPAGRELPAAMSPTTTPTPDGGWSVTPATAVRPASTVEPDGSISPPAPASTHGFRDGDSSRQVTPTPRRAQVVNGAYVVTGAPPPRAGKRMDQSTRPPTRVVNSTSAPKFSATTRTQPRPTPKGTNGGTLPDGRTWVPAPPKGRDT